MANSGYKSGDWLVICDSCAKEIYASQSRKRWDGFQVCAPHVTQGCWEPRQPLDFIRARSDKVSVPFTRPEPADTFVGPTYTDTGNNTIPSGHNNGSL